MPGENEFAFEQPLMIGYGLTSSNNELLVANVTDTTLIRIQIPCKEDSHCISKRYTLCGSYCNTDTHTCQVSAVCNLGQFCSSDNTQCCTRANCALPITSQTSPIRDDTVATAVPWVIVGLLLVILVILIVVILRRRKKAQKPQL